MNLWKNHSATIVLVLAGVLFLVPTMKHIIKGESVSFSPALATAIGFLLGAVIAFVFRRKSGGGSPPPGPG